MRQGKVQFFSIKKELVRTQVLVLVGLDVQCELENFGGNHVSKYEWRKFWAFWAFRGENGESGLSVEWEHANRALNFARTSARSALIFFYCTFQSFWLTCILSLECKWKRKFWEFFSYFLLFIDIKVVVLNDVKWCYHVWCISWIILYFQLIFTKFKEHFETIYSLNLTGQDLPSNCPFGKNIFNIFYNSPFTKKYDYFLFALKLL